MYKSRKDSTCIACGARSCDSSHSLMWSLEILSLLQITAVPRLLAYIYFFISQHMWPPNIYYILCYLNDSLIIKNLSHFSNLTHIKMLCMLELNLLFTVLIFWLCCPRNGISGAKIDPKKFIFFPVSIQLPSIKSKQTTTTKPQDFTLTLTV